MAIDMERAEPVYFATPAGFRRWLERHGASASEIAVGFMKRATGVPCMTWPESVDEALCFGWIDGVRHRIDDERYRIRFTPRKPGSHWSAVNIARMAVLHTEGRVTAAGLAAFEQRTEARSRRASYEQPAMPELAPADLKALKRDKAAWQFFEAQPPSYRKRVVWWVVSARQPATHDNRLAALIAACHEGRRR